MRYTSISILPPVLCNFAFGQGREGPPVFFFLSFIELQGGWRGPTTFFLSPHSGESELNFCMVFMQIILLFVPEIDSHPPHRKKGSIR